MPGMSSRRPTSAHPVPSSRRRNSSDRSYGSRRSGAGSESEDFVYNCRAAYLVVFDDVSDNISSKDQLRNVLQQSGRNPTTKHMNKFWKPSRDGLSFDDFVDICREMPATTEQDLMKAFKKIDINGDGYISNSELFKVMTTRGEKMTRGEVQAIIDEVDENNDGKMDYREFCNMMLSTQEEAIKSNVKRLEKREKDRRPAKQRVSPGTQRKDRSFGSQSSLSLNESADSLSDLETGAPKPRPRPRKSIDGISDEHTGRLIGKDRPKSPVAMKKTKLPEPKRLKDWKLAHNKGSFLFDDDGKIISHQYGLMLSKPTSVWITIQPSSTRGAEDGRSARDSAPPVDTMLFVVREKPDADGNIVATFSEQRDSKGKYCIRADLEKGRYRLIPFSTGCRFKPRRSEPKMETKLVKKDSDDKYVLTKPFKDALVEIFDMCDLDGNRHLSRDEFNWFNIRTSGEEVADEEWEVVEENVDLKNGELTLKGFLQLNQMEAEDNEGDTEDLWVTLSSMGYNKGLVMDEACPFTMDIYCEDCEPKVRVVELGPGGQKLDKAVVEATIAKGDATRVKSMKDLYLHTYYTAFTAWLLVENKSRSRVTMKIDCSKGKNCITNRDKLDYSVTVSQRENMVAHYILPGNERQEWMLKCTETVIK